ncbi:MAG: hypothetical protein VBE63_14230 [Lamprobacter sp.]|jgi:hypothetical protein|nr:hypothetical protein [Lamprobacter sp.]MEA3641082.1 hypothetical protein [Lamprobacter sp.]
MTDETTTEPRDEQLRQWHRLFGIAPQRKTGQACGEALGDRKPGRTTL